MKASCAAGCSDLGKLDSALAALDAALAGVPQALAPTRPLREPGAVDSVYVAAVGLIDEGKYEEAIGQLEEAVWSDGPHPDLLTDLG